MWIHPSAFSLYVQRGAPTISCHNSCVPYIEWRCLSLLARAIARCGGPLTRGLAPIARRITTLITHSYDPKGDHMTTSIDFGFDFSNLRKKGPFCCSTPPYWLYARAGAAGGLWKRL